MDTVNLAVYPQIQCCLKQWATGRFEVIPYSEAEFSKDYVKLLNKLERLGTAHPKMYADLQKKIWSSIV